MANKGLRLLKKVKRLELKTMKGKITIYDFCRF